MPGLASIEAALGALGWALVPVPKLKMLPEELRSKVEALAADFTSEDEALGAAIAAAAAFPAQAAKDVANLPGARRRVAQAQAA